MDKGLASLGGVGTAKMTQHLENCVILVLINRLLFVALSASLNVVMLDGAAARPKPRPSTTLAT